jgi:hypothetical protein
MPCLPRRPPLSVLLQVAGIFTNFFGGVAGSKFGLFCMLLSSLGLQILCLVSAYCSVHTNTACGHLICSNVL